MTTLSLIVPCYNCQATLEEAIASIYQQESQIPFEVTMVDDGSTDGTFQLMERLAREYPRIQLVRHASNLGGGAARNTAVAYSQGDLIFCLDSDDMLGRDFLRNMTGFWMQKECDGLGISTSVKFRNRNLSDVAYVNQFDGPGEKVRFETLLDSSACSLYSTFLITRTAFNRIGGYPTAHGFDTQGMAFRFLCNGMTAYTCPETVYYHRVGFHESYYVREDRAGRGQWNIFQILGEFLYMFRDEAKAKILDYEYFAKHARAGLLDVLRTANHRESVFREDFRQLARLGRDRVAAILEESRDKYDQYWLGTYHLSRGSHLPAMHAFVRALEAGFAHQVIYGQLLETALRVSGNGASAKISVGNLTYHVNDPKRLAESSEPPLSRYQLFENRIMRRTHLRVLGKALKGIRLLAQRIRTHRRNGIGARES